MLQQALQQSHTKLFMQGLGNLVLNPRKEPRNSSGLSMIRNLVHVQSKMQSTHAQLRSCSLLLCTLAAHCHKHCAGMLQRFAHVAGAHGTFWTAPSPSISHGVRSCASSGSCEAGVSRSTFSAHTVLQALPARAGAPGLPALRAHQRTGCVHRAWA